MGQEVPEEWPELIDGLWYKLTVQRYFNLPGQFHCEGTLVDIISCCQLGETIRAFIVGDRQCNNTTMCGFPTFRNQRIVGIIGPFENQVACLIAL